MLNKSELERAIRSYENKTDLNYEGCEKLSHLCALYDRYFGEPIPSVRSTTDLNDIFPALAEYQNTRSISDFRKLCNEIEEFCNAIYVSTENDEERSIYNRMIDNLRK